MMHFYLAFVQVPFNEPMAWFVSVLSMAHCWFIWKMHERTFNDEHKIQIFHEFYIQDY